jgi:hypothetical protein
MANMVITQVRGPNLFNQNLHLRFQLEQYFSNGRSSNHTDQVRFDNDIKIYPQDYYQLVWLAQEDQELRELLESVLWENPETVNLNDFVHVSRYGVITNKGVYGTSSRLYPSCGILVVNDFRLGDYIGRGHCGLGRSVFLHMLKLALLQEEDNECHSVMLHAVIPQSVGFWEKLGFTLNMKSSGCTDSTTVSIESILEFNQSKL